MTLLPTYPPIKGCHYWVHLKGGRVVGPFRRGWWALEPSPDSRPGSETQDVERLRFAYTPPTERGSLGFNPEEIDRVEVRCGGAVRPDPDVQLLDDVIDDIKAALDAWKAAKQAAPTTPPSPPSGPAAPRCIHGEMREALSHTESGNWVLKKVAAEDPYKHWKNAAKHLTKRAADKLWDTVARYFQVGSAAHVKCYVYAHYERTVVEVYEVVRCVDGVWVKQAPRRARTVVRRKVRLHVGGVPCQKPEVFTPPREIAELEGISDWGWIEEE